MTSQMTDFTDSFSAFEKKSQTTLEKAVQDYFLKILGEFKILDFSIE